MKAQSRLAITVALISTLPANNYDELFCDDLNDGTETVDLSSYNSKVISNTTNYNFSYYNSLSGAENETASSKITNFSSLQIGFGRQQNLCSHQFKHALLCCCRIEIDAFIQTKNHH